MPKPWAKYQIGFIDSAKFHRLNANAIVLWLEGKNYADAHLTDGLLPIDVVKRFRFFSNKCVAMLTTSAGQKSANSPELYRPLWEAHPVGYKMHDYLEHNDCREEVLARMAQVDESRDVDRVRLKAWRAAKKAKRETPSETASETPSETPSETALKRSNQKQHQKQNQKEQESERPPLPPLGDARSKRPIFSGQKLVVFEWMLDDCMRTLGTYTDAFDLHDWFFKVDARAVALNLVLPKKDGGAWLHAELLAEVKQRGIPLVIAGAEDPEDVWAALSKKGPSVRP